MIPPSPPALQLDGATIPFGGRVEPGAPGLLELSLRVEAGERWVLVGASGSGKTTLLKGIAGLLPMTGGAVEIGGRKVGNLPPEARNAVYLHQTPVLFPHLTVEENVAFPLRVRGLSLQETRLRVQEVLEAVQLLPLAARDPGALSGGQRHRVALARAVVARPSLLLLDEPLSSLDPPLRREVREAMIELQGRYNPGVLLVTHDLEEAGRMAHQMGILLNGELAQVGPPERLFRSPSSLSVARFLGYRNELPRMGGKEVAVFPPGTLRLVPRGGSDAPTRDGWEPLSLTGVVESVIHPGPRPLARVRINPGDGAGPIWEVELEAAEVMASGQEVGLWFDPQGVRVFPAEG
jgi:ABC-type sugar transport system ATPase subunit